ncbi:hypothetical protein ACVVIH_07020 [Chryseobacterium arthrosphaerae]
MESDVRDFVESYKSKPGKKFSLSDLVTRDGSVSFSKLLKEHNHEIWKKCECGNEEDLRMTWHCSKCGKVLFKL